MIARPVGEGEEVRDEALLRTEKERLSPLRERGRLLEMMGEHTKLESRQGWFTSHKVETMVL